MFIFAILKYLGKKTVICSRQSTAVWPDKNHSLIANQASLWDNGLLLASRFQLVIEGKLIILCEVIDYSKALSSV